MITMLADGGVALGSMADYLGFLLRMSQVEAFKRVINDGDMSEAKLGELSILRVIDLNPGIRQGVLARTLRIKRANMTKLVRQMETQEFVRSTIPSEDRRSAELWLTDTGKAWLELYWPEIYVREQSVEVGLTVKELDVLKGLLRRYLSFSEAYIAMEKLTP